MNDAHFHLVVNHLPIILPLVASIILIVGFFSISEIVKRTAYVIFIIGALSTPLAMYSGDKAEKVIEKVDINAKTYIEQHEEAAEAFAVTNYALGIISLIALLGSYKEFKFLYFLSIAVLLISFITLFFAKQTGTTGGEIRHTEIRNDN
jgi:uncharacterized membrane protein